MSSLSFTGTAVPGKIVVAVFACSSSGWAAFDSLWDERLEINIERGQDLPKTNVDVLVGTYSELLQISVLCVT